MASLGNWKLKRGRGAEQADAAGLQPGRRIARLQDENRRLRCLARDLPSQIQQLSNRRGQARDGTTQQ